MDQHTRQTGFGIPEVQSNPDKPSAPSPQRTTLVIRAGAIIFVLLVVCSYLFHWHWTGFDNNTLWQWLKLLLVPLAAALVPFWLGTHARWQSLWNIVLAGTLALLVVLLVATYALNWKWTGFHGTTLWDWLNMLLLPLVLTALMVWVSVKPRWQPQWTLPIAGLCGIFVLIVVGGYAFR